MQCVAIILGGLDMIGRRKRLIDKALGAILSEKLGPFPDQIDYFGTMGTLNDQAAKAQPLVAMYDIIYTVGRQNTFKSAPIIPEEKRAVLKAVGMILHKAAFKEEMGVPAFPDERIPLRPIILPEERDPVHATHSAQPNPAFPISLPL